MSDTIIAALISAAVTLLVCLITQNKTRALIEYKLDELTKRVDKHNNVIERTFKLEKDVAVVKEQIRELGNKGE